MNLCQDIINAEENPDKTYQDELNWIKEHTTKDLNIPFIIVETFVSRNASKPLTYTVEVPVTNTRPKRYKEFEIIELLIEMKKAYEGMRAIVTKIAKKYSMDVPFQRGETMLIPSIE
jgi:hypothetical protein